MLYPSSFPIDPVLPNLKEAVRAHPAVILRAPPGSGKTTQVPQAAAAGLSRSHRPLQAMFGQADTPTVAEGRVKVLVHLLSPARRPVQVTQDLRAFWNSGYALVRKELKGRYPKHPWPDDP